MWNPLAPGRGPRLLEEAAMMKVSNPAGTADGRIPCGESTHENPMTEQKGGHKGGSIGRKSLAKGSSEGAMAGSGVAGSAGQFPGS